MVLGLCGFVSIFGEVFSSCGASEKSLPKLGMGETMYMAKL